MELVISDIDTDFFGTFSGEVERKFPPIETAIAKAKAGMNSTGLKLGIASEGSIGNDPVIPLLISDIEIMVLVDLINDLVITESYRSFDITASTFLANVDDDLTDYLSRIDFPNQKLIAKSNPSHTEVIKGIGSSKELRKAISKLAVISNNGKVKLEPDFRAHNSPSRQKNITKVAKLLVSRIEKLCPECALPGFGKITYARGLSCSICRLFDEDAIKGEILICEVCQYAQNGRNLDTTLDPSKCKRCNP